MYALYIENCQLYWQHCKNKTSSAKNPLLIYHIFINPICIGMKWQQWLINEALFKRNTKFNWVQSRYYRRRQFKAYSRAQLRCNFKGATLFLLIEGLEQERQRHQKVFDKHELAREAAPCKHRKMTKLCSHARGVFWKRKHFDAPKKNWGKLPPII